MLPTFRGLSWKGPLESIRNFTYLCFVNFKKAFKFQHPAAYSFNGHVNKVWNGWSGCPNVGAGILAPGSSGEGGR